MILKNVPFNILARVLMTLNSTNALLARKKLGKNQFVPKLVTETKTLFFVGKRKSLVGFQVLFSVTLAVSIIHAVCLSVTYNIMAFLWYGACWYDPTQHHDCVYLTKIF